MNILLDADIFQWVLLPILVIMLCVGLLRHYATQMLGGKAAVDVRVAKEKRQAAYAQLVLRGGYYLTPEGFNSRVQLLTAPSTGLLREKVTTNPMMSLMDPSMAGNMGKQQLLYMVPNMIMMNLFSTFFGGFVIAKFPFPLSARFKGMAQRGVDIDNLEASYVTSLSLYFIIMFGMQGIVDLLVGGSTDPQEQMMAQMNPAGQAQANPDINALNKQAIDDLEYALGDYQYKLSDATQSLVEDR
jgi:hypothetical protein